MLATVFGIRTLRVCLLMIPVLGLLALGVLLGNTAMAQDPHWIWSAAHEKDNVPAGPTSTFFTFTATQLRPLRKYFEIS